MARRALGSLLLVCACFQEQPTGSGSSTGDACMPGEVLCPCLDGECNAGLRCVPEGCIPDDCDPGTPTCTCLQPGDICVEGWACLDGLCQPPTGGTSSMTTTPPSSMSADPSLTSVDPGTTGGMDTGGDTGTTVGVGSSGTAADCDAPTACRECMMCVVPNECGPAAVGCGMDAAGCSTTYECILMCLERHDDLVNTCFDECMCNSNIPLRTLIDCIETECPTQCPPLPCGS